MALGRWQATIVDEAGNVLPDAQVTVRREVSGAPLALVYSDRDGVTPLGNPFAADGEGFAAFHVAGGAYRITATKGAFSREWRYVAIGLAAETDITLVREVLTADRTYFVRTDGNDISNNGLTNTAGGAFLTMERARQAVYALDLNGFQAKIKLADGTYTGGLTCYGMPPRGGANFQTIPIAIEGNLATPANVVISCTAANCFAAVQGAYLEVKGVKLQTTTSGDCMIASEHGTIVFDKVEFGACAAFHREATIHGSIINIGGTYTISGSAVGHYHCTGQGFQICIGTVVTLTGTPAFSAYFAGLNGAYVQFDTTTFVGSATGPKFLIHQNGVIQTDGQSPDTYLPGSTPGQLVGGGQWDDKTDKLFFRVGGLLDFGGGDIAIVHGSQQLLFTGGTFRFANDANSAGVQVAQFIGNGKISPADGDAGFNSYYIKNDLGDLAEVGRITWVATDINAATGVDGQLLWGVMNAGVLTNYVLLNPGFLDIIGTLNCDVFNIDQTPTNVSGAGPIAIGSASPINRRIAISFNGVQYWIPATTTAF